MTNLAAHAFLLASLGMFIGACGQRDASGEPDAGEAVEHCVNGEKDGDETDVDCGGSCSPCPAGNACIEPTDCVTGECIDQVCVDTGPSCNNDDECDDEDMCNGIWTCVAGSCQETTAAVVCAALDACHLPGTCAPATGVCTNPSRTCDDTDPCTIDTCDTATGCMYEDKDCDDHDPTTTDSCEAATGNCLHLPPFVDNGDGTVTDTRTDLIWQQTPNSAGFPACDAMMNYLECPADLTLAANYCEGNPDGLPGEGWRLPTISELRSLVVECETSYWDPVTQTGGSCGVTDDCLNYWQCHAGCDGCDYRTGPGEDGHFIDPIFATSGHGWFWSSSPSDIELYEDRGWSLAFYSGLLNNNYVFADFGVRCVREEP